jgi:hypothetical protein
LSRLFHRAYDRNDVGSLRDRRWRTRALVGVALYAGFLLVAQFEHHDLVCHLKTPQHCTSCASSLLGSDPHTPAMPGAWRLADAGRASAFLPVLDDTLLAVKSTGRSPPAPSTPLSVIS